jgi:hypothetical protein
MFDLPTGEACAVVTYDNGDNSGSDALILHAKRG